MKNKEFQLINDLTKILNNSKDADTIGIGDDCALVNFGGEKLIVTVDSMTENVHFLRSYNPKTVGERLTTINVSDIAACGGEPLFGLISLNIPKDLDPQWVKDLYKGIKKGAKKYGFSIIGGNTSSGSDLSFALTLFGKTEKFISRYTAKEGELVFITGKTGLSKRGLELILEKSKKNPFKKSHLQPTARTDVSDFLCKYATSAIDISDGLVQDLTHICEKSLVSINIDSKKLPISTKLIRDLGREKSFKYALESGEDYEIAFTIEEKYRHLAIERGYYQIGETLSCKNHKVYVDATEIEVKGYDHIKKVKKTSRNN